MKAQNTISRRQFIRHAAWVGASAFVAACVPAAPPAEAPIASQATAAPGAATVSILIGPEEIYGEITPTTAFWTYLAEATGVSFDIIRVPYGSLGQQASLKIASGDLPTIMILESPPGSGLTPYAFASQYGAEGLFVKLDEYINGGQMPNLKAMADEFPDAWPLITAGDGHIYGAPRGLFGLLPTGLGLRADLLEQCGIINDRYNPPPARDVITTVDDLYNALTCIQDQMGGGPVLSSRNGPAYTFMRWTFFFGTATGAYYNPATEQYEYGPLMRRYQVWVEFMNRIYSEGILHPEYASMSDEDWQSKVDNVEWGATMDHAGQSPSGGGSSARLRPDTGKDFYVQSLTIDGERILWPRQSIWLADDPAVISTKASPEQIEAAVKVIDFMYSRAGMDLAWFGKEGVDYDVVDGQICMTGNHQCDCYSEAAYCSGEKPASDIPYYWELDLKDYGGHIGRVNQPEYHLGYSSLIFDSYPNRQSEVEAQFSDSGSMSDPIPPLTFTTEEQDTLAQLRAPLDTYVLEETQKFIEGLRPLSDSEWSQFTGRIQELGAQQLVDIYNAALGRVATR